MTRWHWSTTVTALVFVLAGFLAFGGPASAEECYTVSQAVEIMERNGLETFGELPYKGGTAVYYSGYGVVFAAPVVDGCVLPEGEFVPDFIAPEPVTPA